ncbi:MAG: hypothetical protein Q9163_002002 [Psora crenata]
MAHTQRPLAYRGASIDRDSYGEAEDRSISKFKRDGPEEGATDEEDLEEVQSASDRSVNNAPDDELSTISFGALARAQKTLGKRKRSGSEQDNVGKAYPHTHSSEAQNHYAHTEALERKAGKKDSRDFVRASKHAPTEFSSKKAVSRKREVVPIHKQEGRDPRFDPVDGPLNEEKIRKNYTFLDTYREAEIAELKAGLRKAKDPAAKETLKRALTSMESRKKAQQLKEQQQEVLRQHRREERAKVENGKAPFYLKQGDLKKRVLVERFKGLKGKQVDKIIERRRKRQTAKERRGMPQGRRF